MKLKETNGKKAVLSFVLGWYFNKAILCGRDFGGRYYYRFDYLTFFEAKFYETWFTSLQTSLGSWSAYQSLTFVCTANL